MRRASIVAAAGLLTVALGCGSSIQPRIGGARTPTSRDLGDRGLGGRPTIEAGRMVGDSRMVCRTDARPRGWIAVAYVAAEGDCVQRARGDSVPMAAVLTRYTDLPANTVLEVCADQGVPRGWVNDPTPSGDANDNCPGGAKNGSTTRRIRRLP
jgi:hypothetical protein